MHKKIKSCIRHFAPWYSFVFKFLSFTTAQYNTHPYWSFNIYCRLYMAPVIQGV